MTIENPESFVAGIWDWKCLDGCFGDSKIKPQDIDGSVERKGNFLYIEGKSYGVPLKKGKEIYWKNRIKSGNDTVMIVWGDPKTNTVYKLRVMSPFTDEIIDPCDMDGWRKKVADWYSWADSNPRDQSKRLITVEVSELLKNLVFKVTTLEGLLLQLLNQTKSVKPIKRGNVIHINQRSLNGFDE